jgi:glutamate/tyrosine decarboxylase-like PLP-dependent enzyme
MPHASQPPSGPERHAPIDLDPDRFREIGHDLVDRIAAFLEGIDARPVTTGEPAARIRELIDADAGLPAGGSDPGELVARIADLLFDHSLHNGHPRFLGYITSSAAPLGMLADFLASAVNANVGAWTLSPVASEIELQTVRWIAEMLGCDAGSGGLLVSGGNMANMVGFWAARVAAAPEIRERGSEDGRLAVYASAACHTWIQKAADLSGIGTDRVRWIETDADDRMRVDALSDAIEEDVRNGLVPMLVVATGGSVATGAVDDVEAIAEVARAHDAWLHVDGAYGGFGAVLPDAPDGLRHLGLADSVAVDPHKWLYAPLEAGCTIVRDPETLVRAFSYHPPYYHFGSEVTNLVDLGPQNSRGFRALKVWMALKQVGLEGYRRLISDDVAVARALFEHAHAHPDVEAVSCRLSITTFRYRPADLDHSDATDAYLDELNREIQSRLEREGEAFLSNAILGDRYLLRGCVVNFRTTEDDAERIIEIVAETGRRVDAEMRPRPS